MKTKSYNPSPLEVEFVTVIESLQKDINKRLAKSEVQSFEHNINIDASLFVTTKLTQN